METDVSNSKLQPFMAELEELDSEFPDIEKLHKQYSEKVEEMKALQQQCLKVIGHQRYRIKQILGSVKRVRKNVEEKDKATLSEVDSRINQRKAQFRELEDNLPHRNGLYLNVILGQAPVSIIGKAEKFAYKAEYEKFKLILSVIVLAVCIGAIVLHHRVTDALFHFLLVWYYCMLTVRESILKVNGSRIKGWWVAHHFISTFCAGVFVTWPEGTTYQLFRQQFLVFSFYLSVVQLMQYYYQSGCLYRQRALGEGHKMDITVEGFHSWMWRGLTFLLPFLFGAYCFELYNSYILLTLSFHPQCTEWQVPMLSINFFILFVGNLTTILAVIRKKIRSREVQKRWEWARRMLRAKYNLSRVSSKNHSNLKFN